MRLQTLYKLSDTDVAAWMMAACKLKVTVSTMRKIMDCSGENATTLSPAENSSSRDTSASIYDVTRAMLSTPDGRESPSEQTFYFLRRLYDTLGVNPMREICFAMCAREFYALETEQIAQIFFLRGIRKGSACSRVHGGFRGEEHSSIVHEAFHSPGTHLAGH